MSRRTRSQIPPSGLDKGTWDYIREPAIAAGYDAGLRDDPLTSQDQQLVAELLEKFSSPERLVVADFGCGTGRSVLPLLPLGCRILAIDLSLPMLEQLQIKLVNHPSPDRERILCVQANLLKLECFTSNSIDLGLCLYSTFGMLRGKTIRAKFLEHVVRMLKPGGRLVFHAHNLWWQLNFPGGLRWLLQNRIQSLFDRRLEFGDRFADQRTIRQLPIHSFTLGGLLEELQRSGLDIESIHPYLDPGGTRRWLVRACRINSQGWTLIARKK